MMDIDMSLHAGKIIALVIFLLILPVTVFASGFQLKTIGALNVDGVTYSHLWYSSTNVTFTGITPAGTDVTATIDGAANAATVDAGGNWTYTTTLTEGDHPVQFSSSAGSVSFTLTIGATPDGVGALTPPATPTVGIISPTIIAIAGGSAFLLFGMLTLRRRP